MRVYVIMCGADLRDLDLRPYSKKMFVVNLYVVNLSVPSPTKSPNVQYATADGVAGLAATPDYLSRATLHTQACSPARPFAV